MAETQTCDHGDSRNEPGSTESLSQVTSILSRHLVPLDIRLASDGRSFASLEAKAPRRPGILSVRGALMDDATLAVRLECLRAPHDIRMMAGALFDRLAALNEKCRIIKSVREPKDGETSLWIEMKVMAAPMSLARESVFVGELEKLDALAGALQGELPDPSVQADLVKLYASVAEHLEPILPWPFKDLDAGILDWARNILAVLEGNASVAIASAFPVEEQAILVLLAAVGREFNRTIGKIISPSINARGLVELAKKAPGLVAVPAMRICMGSNPYEIHNEISTMLAVLSSAGTPALFIGSMDQLQSVFSGGQGGANDPLYPVVRHAPALPVPILAHMAVHCAGQLKGGLSPAAEHALTSTVLHALDARTPAVQRRLLPLVAARTASAWLKGKKPAAEVMAAYASTLGAFSETLSGLTPMPRALRAPEVQEHYTDLFAGGHLLAHFQQSLLAQDRALGELAARLCAECLTRPLHQPFRYCAQGTPGTGKSESAVLIARRLNIPYVNIDAASMPDYYSAAAQLLGSGRGIVGSYQSGRLEQVAKHHKGAVMEVSDLDHAVPSVRSALADLFLQILETGEGQSTSGAVFSCANLIVAFTMNLPDGMDEAVRKRIGFNEAISRRDLTAQVSAHIKQMLSGAFLSRVGTPIVFDPLDGTALAAIMERAIREALLSAAERFHLEVTGITLAAGLGAAAVKFMAANLTSFGARALLEYGRGLAASAFIAWHQQAQPTAPCALQIAFLPNGKLEIVSN